MQELAVALLTPCFWPEVRRGSERFVRELADGLRMQGGAPTVITSHRGPPSRRVEQGVPIIRLPRPPQRPLLKRNYELYLTHIPLSYAALAVGDYRVAHAVYPSDALAAARWRRRDGRVAVLSYMGIPELHWLDQRRGRRRLLFGALARCDATVALSESAAEAFRRLGYDAPIIPPAVDLELFTPGEARANPPAIVCSAAADEPRKNVKLLVEALALVREELPEAQLILSRPRDPSAAARNGVDLGAPGVRLEDLDEGSALARAYRSASLAVLPSVGEAFGLVLAEALACGTPVVGYDHGAIPELIDRESIGRLCPTLEPRALADAMLDAIQLTRDPETVARCRERAAEFSVERCTSSYLELYRDLGAR